jgi:hypothetical protein
MKNFRNALWNQVKNIPNDMWTCRSAV